MPCRRGQIVLATATLLPWSQGKVRGVPLALPFKSLRLKKAHQKGEPFSMAGQTGLELFISQLLLWNYAELLH